MTHQGCFDLVGDGDDVDLLVEIEGLFGITIADHEAETIETFGQLVDLVESKVQTQEVDTCLLMHAWRQIRDSGAVDAKRCRPSDRLAATFLSGSDIVREIRQLSRASGLDLSVGMERAGKLGLSAEAWLGGAALIAVAVAMQTGNDWPFVAFGVAAAAMICLWPQRLPRNLVSLGDLVRQSLPNNFNLLQSRFGPGNAADRRVAIEATCRNIACYAGPVTDATTFISKRHIF